MNAINEFHKHTHTLSLRQTKGNTVEWVLSFSILRIYFPSLIWSELNRGEFLQWLSSNQQQHSLYVRCHRLQSFLLKLKFNLMRCFFHFISFVIFTWSLLFVQIQISHCAFLIILCWVGDLVQRMTVQWIIQLIKLNFCQRNKKQPRFYIN